MINYGLDKITKPSRPIYQQLYNYYYYCDKRCRFSPVTMDFKTRNINYFVQFSRLTRLEDITNDMIDEWVAYQVSRDNSGRTINHRLYQMKVMLKWQRDDNVIMPNVKISRISMQREDPPRKRYFTREQIDKALSFADRREWLMIQLAFECGLRISELRKLRLSDIEDRKIKVIGKCRKLRHCFMSEETRKRLDDYIVSEQISDCLWPSAINNSSPMCTQNIRKAIQRVFDAAGLHGMVPHDLRHSFATELKNMGISTREIQVGLGHSTQSVTEQYLHDLDGYEVEQLYERRYQILRDEEEADAVDRISNSQLLEKVLLQRYLDKYLDSSDQPEQTLSKTLALLGGTTTPTE